MNILLMILILVLSLCLICLAYAHTIEVLLDEEEEMIARVVDAFIKANQDWSK